MRLLRERQEHLQESGRLICMRVQLKTEDAYRYLASVSASSSSSARPDQSSVVAVDTSNHFFLTNLSVKWDGGQAPLQRVQVKTEELLSNEIILGVVHSAMVCLIF